MKRIVLLLGILLVGVMLFACPSKVVPVEKPISPEALTQEAQVTGKESWQVEWERTVVEAKKEGKLTIYGGTPPQVREAWTEVFKEKFEITLEFVMGRGADVISKLVQERRAALFIADLYVGGGTSMYQALKPIGAFDKLEPLLFHPEVLEPDAWYGSQLPWFDAGHTMFYYSLAPSGPLYINTEMIKSGEIKSYRDFIHPKWKGKILLFDPVTPGQGLQWFSIYGGKGILGLDYMRALAKQDPVILRDMLQQATWVARGRYPISIGVGWTRFEPFISAGAPVAKLVVEEPDYLSAASSHVALINKAPHPFSAKLFVNWLFSKEGQSITQRAYERQSAREDIGHEGLDPLKAEASRIKGAKYIRAEDEEEYKKKDMYAEKALEIFGPLMK